MHIYPCDVISILIRMYEYLITVLTTHVHWTSILYISESQNFKHGKTFCHDTRYLIGHCTLNNSLFECLLHI